MSPYKMRKSIIKNSKVQNSTGLKNSQSLAR